MDDGEDYEGQRVTAYHEAGHAIAAIKCPDGCIKYIDICDRNEDDEENGATFATTQDADDAFRIYAGPWAEAKLRAQGGSINADVVFDRLRANEDDWTAFQRVVGNDVGDSAWTAMQESLMGFGDPISAEYRPPEAWHEKAHIVLARAWDDGEIQALAKQMLVHQKEIELGNGQRLVREDGRDRWHGTDYREAPHSGSGLVGSPPPFSQGV